MAQQENLNRDPKDFRFRFCRRYAPEVSVIYLQARLSDTDDVDEEDRKQPMPFTITPKSSLVQVEPKPGGTYDSPEAITAQPKGRFNHRPLLPSCVLDDVDEVILEQKLEKEMLSDNFDANTEFSILNVYRQPLLTTVEDIDFCIHSIWGRLRPINLFVKNLNGEDLFYAHRKHNCCRCGCLFSCNYCEESMTVEMNDMVVGHISHRRHFGKPTYSIMDERESVLYTVVSRRFPTCTKCCLGSNINFQIKKGNINVGEIKKHRLTIIPDPGYDRPYARLKFPQDATLVEKILLLAAAFYVEVHYFDEDPLTFMKT